MYAVAALKDTAASGGSANETPVNDKYIERIKEKIRQVTIRKEEAVAVEDYRSALQIKQQLISLTSQLFKIENQLIADIISHILGAWQHGLALSLRHHLTPGQSASGSQPTPIAQDRKPVVPEKDNPVGSLYI